MIKLNFYILDILEETSNKVFKILNCEVYKNRENGTFYIFAFVMCVTDNTYFRLIIEEEYKNNPIVLSFIEEKQPSLI